MQEDIIFWPDLASSHYAESVMDFMIEKRINFVEKYENPANVPEVRPIEQFWAILKARVYDGGWRANNLPELRKRIRKCIKKVDTNQLTALIECMHKNMKAVGVSGVVERRTIA